MSYPTVHHGACTLAGRASRCRQLHKSPQVPKLGPCPPPPPASQCTAMLRRLPGCEPRGPTGGDASGGEGPARRGGQGPAVAARGRGAVPGCEPRGPTGGDASGGEFRDHRSEAGACLVDDMGPAVFNRQGLLTCGRHCQYCTVLYLGKSVLQVAGLAPSRHEFGFVLYCIVTSRTPSISPWSRSSATTWQTEMLCGPGCQ